MARLGKEMTRSGFEERNLARVYPVISSKRLPNNFQRWYKDVAVDSLSRIRISCTAGLDHVTPYGNDNDIIFALSNIFVLQGMPESNTITVSLADIVRYAGISKGGQTYRRAYESLQRLRHVSYEVIEGFAYKSRKGKIDVVSMSFGIINSITSKVSTLDDTDKMLEDNASRYKPSNIFVIELSKPIAESARLGFLVEVDLNLLSKLDNYLSRSVYRSLQERRTRTGESEILMSLMEWGNYLGISRSEPYTNEKGQPVHRLLPQTPDKIRRSLEIVHRDLLRVNYLSKAEFIGRGSAQTVQYVFSEHAQPLDMEVVGWLTMRKVSGKVAAEYAQRYDRHHITRAVSVFDAKISGGYLPKNPAGYLLSIIDNIDDYNVEPRGSGIQTTQKTSTSTRTTSLPEPLFQPTPEDQRKTRAFLFTQWHKKGVITSDTLDDLLRRNSSGFLDERTVPSGLTDPQKIQSIVDKLLT